MNSILYERVYSCHQIKCWCPDGTSRDMFAECKPTLHKMHANEIKHCLNMFLSRG